MKEKLIRVPRGVSRSDFFNKRNENFDGWEKTYDGFKKINNLRDGLQSSVSCSGMGMKRSGN